MKISSVTVENPVGENQFFFDEDNNHSWLDIVPKNFGSKMDGPESERSRPLKDRPFSDWPEI